MIAAIIYSLEKEFSIKNVMEIKKDLKRALDLTSIIIVDATNITKIDSSGVGLLLETMVAYRDKYFLIVGVKTDIIKTLCLLDFSKDLSTSVLFESFEDAMQYAREKLI